MRKYPLYIGAAVLLMTPAVAQPATITNTAATITYDDNHTFGGFASTYENQFDDGWFGNLSFNRVANVEASAGQEASATASMSLTITAAPGYELTYVSASESGNWVTGNPGTVNVATLGSIVDSATGDSIGTPFSATTNPGLGIFGTTLASGSWFSSGTTSGPSLPRAVTLQFSRTLFASGGIGGNALIGNTAFPFNDGNGLFVGYSARLIPEPQTYAALAIGLIVMIAVGRKRQRR